MALTLAALLVAVGAAGCSGDDDGDSPRGSADGTTAATAPVSEASGVTGNSIRRVDFANALVQFPSIDPDADELEHVTLVDGVYTSDDPDADVTFARLIDVDYADLDGDGAEEAALSWYVSTGGTGQFTDVLVYRWGGDNAIYVTSDGYGDRAFGGLDRVEVAPADDAGDTLLVRRLTDDGAACCPAGIEQRSLRLSGDELVPVGEPESWGLIPLGNDGSGEEPAAPTVVKFLPGTSRAQLTGNADEPVSATFDASEGQTMQLAFDGDALQLPVLAVVTGPGGEVARVGAGATTEASEPLPVSGTYTIEVQPVGEVDDDTARDFSLDLIIL